MSNKSCIICVDKLHIIVKLIIAQKCAVILHTQCGIKNSTLFMDKVHTSVKECQLHTGVEGSV